MEEFLKSELEASKRYNHSFSIAMIDIDDFKKINDTFGHESGDEALKTLADIMRTNMRKADVVCRYGGEEFIILLPKTLKENAVKCMEKLRKLFHQKAFIFNEKTIHITASFGVASYPEDSCELEDLLVLSDIRLYRAKRHGKNRIEWE